VSPMSLRLPLLSRVSPKIRFMSSVSLPKMQRGEPLESAPVIMRNPFVPPGTPREIEITNITRDSMTVCWNRPETNGGSEIVGYIVEKRDRAGIRWTKCNKRRVTDLRFRVTGLPPQHSLCQSWLHSQM
uniref:Fibronectin type-III domain-containing protein n=1 Tax=Hippocampus comes TaxID=109280 RepID=A0A3Q2Y690_HIPCM